jgi:hypothetical protein
MLGQGLDFPHTKFISRQANLGDETREIDGSRAVRVIQGDWQDRDTLAVELLGFARVDEEDGVRVLNRRLPSQFPGDPRLYATKVTRIAAVGWKEKVETPRGRCPATSWPN